MSDARVAEPGVIQIAFRDTRRVLGDLVRHRRLFWEITRREFSDPHAGQALGAAWTVLHPLVLLGIYVFIFGVVFSAKVGGTREMPLDYTAYILSGMVPWLASQQAALRSCGAIVSRESLVKQVVFPLEILPGAAVVTTAFAQLVGVMVLVVYILVTNGALPWTMLLLPLVLVFHWMLLLGIALALSAASVFLRDLREIVQVLSAVGVFIIPVVYLPAWVPEAVRPLLYVNPVSAVIWVYQDVFYFGRIEHPGAWFAMAGITLLTLVVGARMFRWSQPMFGDAL